MKNNYLNNPIILHPAISFEKEQAKENLVFNRIAKRELKRCKEKIKDAVIYITFDSVYFRRYLKRKNKLN